MNRDLETIRLTLEEEVPELRTVDDGSLVMAVLFFLLSLGAGAGLYFVFTLFANTRYSWGGALMFLPIFALASYFIGSLLNGPSSQAGADALHRGSMHSRFSFGTSRSYGDNLMFLGMLLMFFQFIFFGVYAAVEQIKASLASKNDVRSRIGAGVVQYLLSKGSCPEEELLGQLAAQDCRPHQIRASLDILKEKSLLLITPDGLKPAPSLLRLFP